jgi:hypothetical protein
LRFSCFVSNTIKRAEFVQAIAGKTIDVSDAGSSEGLHNVDFQRADLNHDGKIHGANEASALFSELDRVDRDGNPDALNISPKTGVEPRKLVDAVARLARAENLRLLAAGDALPVTMSGPRGSGIGADATRRSEARVWRHPNGPTEIEANDHRNEIKIEKAKGDAYSVKVDNVNVLISREDARRGIVVRAGAGDDSVEVAKNVAVKVSIYGEGGDDNFKNGSTFARIYGGQGTDFAKNEGYGASVTAENVVNTGKGAVVVDGNLVTNRADSAVINLRGKDASAEIAGNGNTVIIDPSSRESSTVDIRGNDNRVLAKPRK